MIDMPGKDEVCFLTLQSQGSFRNDMNSLPLCASASAAVFRQRAMRLQGICQAVLSIWGSRIEYFVVLHWCQRNTRQMRTVDCGSFPDSGAPPFFFECKKKAGTQQLQSNA